MCAHLLMPLFRHATGAGVNLNQSWEVPCSGTPNIAQLVTSSNVGDPGVWIFRIDESIVPACPTESRPSICIIHVLL